MKTKIPKALREQLWLKVCGKIFEYKCSVKWCTNVMTPFTFEAGHIIPESKGGATNLHNLLPLCSSCNKSMGNRYSINEFSIQFSPPPSSQNPFDIFRYCIKPKVSLHQKPFENGSRSYNRRLEMVQQSQVQPDIPSSPRNLYHHSQ